MLIFEKYIQNAFENERPVNYCYVLVKLKEAMLIPESMTIRPS